VCVCGTRVLHDAQVVVGTDNNTVMLFEGSELKAEHVVHGEQKSVGFRIETVAACGGGFVCGGSQGTLVMFAPDSEASGGEKDSASIRFERVMVDQVTRDTDSHQTIHTIAISPSQRSLVASTDKQQLYTTRLAQSHAQREAAAAAAAAGDTTAAADGSPVVDEDDDDASPTGLRLVLPAAHHGAVVDISLARRKPLAATCSTDGSVRVWNYEAGDLELKK
jgi:WD40 repeat protein